jgi:hypothetical protein
LFSLGTWTQHCAVGRRLGWVIAVARSVKRTKAKPGPQRRSPAALDAPRPGAGKGDATGSSRRKWTIVAAASTVVGLLLAGGLTLQLSTGGLRNLLFGAGSKPAAVTFVGSEACAGCHYPQAELWRSSQHRKAMDHATESSVLGDFNDATFDYYGVRSRFFRKDGRFFVETDGPDGKFANFQVKYTFGFDPLQQYLVEFPDGRL